MKAYERDEIASLPAKYRPLTAWNYFWLTLLFQIPVVGLVFTIIFAISGSNINRRSFARSFFCVLILEIILVIILAVTGGLAAIIRG